MNGKLWPCFVFLGFDFLFNTSCTASNVAWSRIGWNFPSKYSPLWEIRPRYAWLVRILLILAFEYGVRFFDSIPNSVKNFPRDSRVYFPVAYASNALTRIFESVGCGSIVLVLGLLIYPNGALVSHSPRRSFWRIPRLTFSTRLSEKYLLCPNATCNINFPCGVGSNQNCGKRKVAILLISTR